MRPPGGPAAPPEPRGRGFVRRAHMSHEERRAAQARRRLADWRRDLTQASAAEASAAEFPSGEESDAESEAGGNGGSGAPRPPGWTETADWRPRPSCSMPRGRGALHPSACQHNRTRPTTIRPMGTLRKPLDRPALSRPPTVSTGPSSLRG